MASMTATRTTRSKNRRRHTHNEGIIPLLARAVREVEADYDRWSDAARVRVEELYKREQAELAAFGASVARLAGTQAF